MKRNNSLLALGALAIAAPANAAVTFHNNIGDWRSGAAGGLSSHAPAAERLETFDDTTNATINGWHVAVSTGSPYQDIDFTVATTLTVGPTNNTSSSVAINTADDFRTGTAGNGIRIRPATTDGGVGFGSIWRSCRNISIRP